jgi:hypothetical protein
MRKTSAIVGTAAALVAGLIVTAGPAAAAPPAHEHLTPGSYELEVGFCSFPVEVIETKNTVMYSEFANGDVFYRGGYAVRLVNGRNPSKHLDMDASGTYLLRADGTDKLDGTNLLLLKAGRDYTSGIYILTGSWSTTDSADGVAVLSLQGTGRKSGNLCDAIA